MNDIMQSGSTEQAQRIPTIFRVLLPLLAIVGLVLVGSYGLAALLAMVLISAGH